MSAAPIPHARRPRRGRHGAWCRALALFAGLAASGASSGCGGGDGGPSDPSPEQIAAALTAEGWTQFESGAFPAAGAKFRAAIGALATYADAHNGLGWSLALVDSLPAADSAFADAVASGHATADPRAGRAFVRADLVPPDLRGALDEAGAALAIAPLFAFAHDASIDWRDLRLLRAQAYFQTNVLDSAAAEVVALGGAPPDPQAPAYADSLLAVIERLGQDALAAR
jgi:hypothetical protein